MAYYLSESFDFAAGDAEAPALHTPGHRTLLCSGPGYVHHQSRLERSGMLSSRGNVPVFRFCYIPVGKFTSEFGGL